MLYTQAEIINAYDSLIHRPESIKASELALYAEWARLDARLAELIISHLWSHYQSLNPFELKNEILKQKTPQSLCVLCDIAEISATSGFKTSQWRLWKKCLQDGIPEAAFQSYDIPLLGIKPERLLRAIDRNLKVYARWGFYGDELPVSQKNRSINRSLLSREVRLQMLKELLMKNREITVGQYIEATGHRIHRRQAERDLLSYPGIRKKSNTRGRTYSL